MTTMTDDIAPRLTALENRVGNVAERVAALEGQVGEMSVALQDLKEGQRELNRRIDRLFYAIIGAGAVVFAGLLGVIAALVVLILRIGSGAG